MTAEHYMMYRKALLFEDQEAVKNILEATNPSAVKAIGRKVRNIDQQVWEEHSFEVVVPGNMAKFHSNPELKAFLLGPEIKFWLKDVDLKALHNQKNKVDL